MWVLCARCSLRWVHHGNSFPTNKIKPTERSQYTALRALLFYMLDYYLCILECSVCVSRVCVRLSVLFAGPFCFDKMWFRCCWSVYSIPAFFSRFVLCIWLFHVFISHFDPSTRVLWMWMLMVVLLLLLSLLLFLLPSSSSFNNINGILATHIYSTPGPQDT